MNLIIKTLTDLPGYYFTSEGIVLSSLVQVPLRVGGKLAGTQTVVGHIRRPVRQFDRRLKNGKASPYLSVQVGGRCLYVHRLICLAFHGTPADEHDQACHINGDPRDNRSINLRWGTQADNDADRREHDAWRRGWVTRREQAHAFSDLLEEP